MIEEVFIAEYNDCIHESQHKVISVHKTKRGAELAMVEHYNCRHSIICEMFDDIEDFHERYDEIEKVLKMEDWRVREVKLEE